MTWPNVMLLFLAGLAGAVILATGIALRGALSSAFARRQRLREEAAERAEAALDVAPAIALVWDWDSSFDRGSPFAQGSTSALKATFKAFGVKAGPGALTRFLEALERTRAVDPETGNPQNLQHALYALREGGRGFESRLLPSETQSVRAYGVTAGPYPVLWLVTEPKGVLGGTSHQPDIMTALLTLPIPVWQRDNEGMVEVSNAAAIGVGTETESGISLGELAAPADTVAREANQAGHPARTRAALTMEGERRHFEIWETPSRGGVGIGLAIDRSEEEDLQRRFARAERAWNAILDEMEAGVAVFGPDRRLAHYNSAFATIWGLEQDTLRHGLEHDVLLDVLHERNALPVQTDYLAWRSAQLSAYAAPDADDDMLWNLPDGRSLLVRRRSHPGGGLLFIFEDMTRQLELEAAYTSVVEVQRTTLDSLSDAVMVFGSDGRLRLYNPAFCDMWGLSEDEASGHPHWSALDSRFRTTAPDEGFWQRARSLVLGLEPEERAAFSQETLRCEDGRVLRASAQPLPDGASLLSFLDITDATWREEALQERNQALEAADQLKSQFISHVSYQLRTPLNAIVGFSEILQDERFGALNEMQRDSVQSIIEASDALKDLIDDVIDLALLEAGRVSLHTAPTDVAALMQDTYRLYRTAADSSGVHLALEVEPELPQAELDGPRIKQVLRCLLDNALAFTEAEGTVHLEARLDDNGELALSVADTGKGIPPHDQSRIFDLFERRAGGGAGLGLALARNLVHLHHGKIELDSELGVGTTVTCRLPLGKSGQPAKRIEADTPEEATGSTEDGADSEEAATQAAAS